TTTRLEDAGPSGRRIVGGRALLQPLPERDGLVRHAPLVEDGAGDRAEPPSPGPAASTPPSFAPSRRSEAGACVRCPRTLTGLVRPRKPNQNPAARSARKTPASIADGYGLGASRLPLVGGSTLVPNRSGIRGSSRQCVAG